MLRLRRRDATRHLACAVEFAAGSHYTWPEAVITISRADDWRGDQAPEALLLPLFCLWLVRTPDAYDRFYGRYVNDATMELLGLIAAHALASEGNARSRKDYGLPLEALRRRLDEREEAAARAFLALVPERVSGTAGPPYARVSVVLQTKKAPHVVVNLPRHEPERGKRREHPEKSLVLASCALIALVDEVCMTADYASVVVPTLEALQSTASAYNALRAAGGWPSTDDLKKMRAAIMATPTPQLS